MVYQGFDLERLREVATANDWVELNHNEISRVLCFRKNTNRINVYYTTRTVGTCLNHPKRGKSQLFRRNVTWEDMELIFENPRVHTGHGYYTKGSRKSKNQKWREVKDDGGRFFEYDSAKRWKYVALSTGLETRDEMLEDLANFFAECDALLWEEDEPPDVELTRFSCGSRSSLTDVCIEELETYYGPISLCSHEEVNEYKNGKRMKKDLQMQNASRCYNSDSFLGEYESELYRLQARLHRFPKKLRTEMIIWIVERNMCGSSLYTRDLERVATALSDAVAQAHTEYGEMMYPKGWNFCPKHGVY